MIYFDCLLQGLNAGKYIKIMQPNEMQTFSELKKLFYL